MDRVDNRIQGELAAPIISMYATIAPPADLAQKQISVVGFSQLFFLFVFSKAVLNALHFLPVGQVFKKKKIKYRVT